MSSPNPPTPPAPAELVARCRAGDDTAVAQLVTTYTPLLERVAAYRLQRYLGLPPERGEVDEVVQEVWAHLLADGCAALARLHNPARLEAWLSTVAGNRTVDLLRRRGAQARTETAYHEASSVRYAPPPDRPALMREEHENVRRALGELSAQDRLVLHLCFDEGLKYSEIAEIMHLNINTVASRIRRAKDKVRAMLELHDA